MTDPAEIEDEILDTLTGDEPVRTPSDIGLELKRRGVLEEYDVREFREHLEDMRERGLVALNHGEWGEYTV
jgi:repressor of nif and glnA expression